ncbi:hypothetical protein RRG08_021950 [Elysia crispata]|uniref:Uncharacterized protein n=1 Tax=Elysia crispata TaxID=231223 RepID=A0AAE1AC06_9GAST|nr:hypothetical protein RRG08_021950 [Elysia crispata]
MFQKRMNDSSPGVTVGQQGLTTGLIDSTSTETFLGVVIVRWPPKVHWFSHHSTYKGWSAKTLSSVSGHYVYMCGSELVHVS